MESPWRCPRGRGRDAAADEPLTRGTAAAAEAGAGKSTLVDVLTLLRDFCIRADRSAIRTADRFRIGYSGVMSTNVNIEVDQHTADVLQMRAAELGVTVAQLIAELATLDSDPREVGSDEIAELDRRSVNAMEGSRVPHERVVQWLRTWGTRRFRPWPDQ